MEKEKKEDRNPSQHWSSDVYNKNARFVTDYGNSLIEWLNPQKDEYILDLGCGDGILTKKIMEYGCRILGIDGSESFVLSARELGVDAVQGDAQKMNFENEFDAVFSNAALHWMLDADGVMKGVAGALKKGGRFIAETGCRGNVKKIENAIHEILKKYNLKAKKCWFFPSVEEKVELLEKNGMKVERIVTFSRPTPLPTGIRGWLTTFSKPVLEYVPSEMHEKIIDEVSEKLEKTLEKDTEGNILADYVRLRFEAYKL